MFQRPPGRVFHAVLVLLGLVLLWAWSFPGFHFVLIVLFWPTLLAAAVWVIRGLTYLRAIERGTGAGTSRWFAVAPVGALLLLAIVVADLPLRARWATSRSAFDRAVDDTLPVGSERRIGSFTITTIRRVEGGVLFYEKAGSFMDDAGFAYLPGGPTPDLASGSLENPRWNDLGGGWYAFTASW